MSLQTVHSLLCSTTKDLITSADARSYFVILRLGVARRVKVGKRRQKGAAEPYGIAVSSNMSVYAAVWAWVG